MRLLSSGRCRTCGGSPYATLSAMVGAGKPASIGLILEITSKYSVSVKEQQNPMAREPGQRTRIRPTVNTTITALTGPANPQTSQARPTMKKDQITLTYGPRQSWDSENRSNSTPLQSLPPRSNSAQTDDYDDSSDEEQRDVRAGLLRSSNKNQARNWNDIPDDFVDPNAPKRNGIKSKRNR